MNRTSIEYADFSWNPVTGCLGPGGTPEEPKRCSYCYAHKLAKGRLRKLYLSNPNVAPGCDPEDPFSPRFWHDRIRQVWLPRAWGKTVFVVNMGDLFHPAVPWEWIDEVVSQTWNRAGTNLFLTKNPARYKEFEQWFQPGNMWIGTTVSNQAELRERWTALREVKARVRFLSVEPFLDWLIWPMGAGVPHWVIMGALTGPEGRQPAREWVDGLTAWCDYLGVPVFHKDNLDCEGMGIERRREWPR